MPNLAAPEPELPPEGAPAPERARGRLFVRIYATSVLSMLVFALLAALLMGAWFSSWDQDWIDATVDRIEAESEPILENLHGDPAAMEAVIAALADELDVTIEVLPRDRRRKSQFGGPPPARGPRAGRPDQPGRPDRVDGPDQPDRPDRPDRAQRPPPRPDTPLQSLHHLTRAELRQLRRGRPVIRRHGMAPPVIGVPLFAPADPDTDPDAQTGRGRPRPVALVGVFPRQDRRLGVVLGGVLLLLALAGGAWPLARSLTTRLASLERSTRALADGELSHRVPLDTDRRLDEIDGLALAFNQMADRLETLMTGQRTLLANVSHELRTPISRIKVLVEILGERIEGMQRGDSEGEPTDTQGLARLERGLGEMQEDLAEVEALISDLLTSGRLELGRDSALRRESIEMAELCIRAGDRFEARVECPADLRFEGDRMLLDRLLRNLLANARRACPDGVITIRVAAIDGGPAVPAGLRIEVEDEGPGVPVEARQQIFEPFARLDAARARDQGGVGLGLYLCRQIVRAHGGHISAEDRVDGRPGARFSMVF